MRKMCNQLQLMDKIKKWRKTQVESVARPSSQNSTSSNESTVDVESGTAGSSEASASDKLIHRDIMCKICYTREWCIVFIPCGHLMTCSECAKDMKTCGMCHIPVQAMLQAYIS